MENRLLDIRKITYEKLSFDLKQWNQPAFRVKQIQEWIWKKKATSFQEMTNLPLSLRQQLEEQFSFYPIELNTQQKSEDGTIKCSFSLYDDKIIEGVLIPTTDRYTACISSQVGCSLTCSFCATGFMARERNIDAAEIFDQVVYLNKISEEYYQHPLTNIVFMGMGEPLLNYREVKSAINIITSPDGLNMSPKRITLSTAGIAKMIRKLADDNLKVNLALSLHAADDEKRSNIMPINDQNNLSSLIDALRYYYEIARKPITFEYVMLEGVNDSLEDAKKLEKICRKIPSKVNLIQYNPVEQSGFSSSKEENIQSFAGYLRKNNVNIHIRYSRGKDIDAACGQLANKH